MSYIRHLTLPYLTLALTTATLTKKSDDNFNIIPCSKVSHPENRVSFPGRTTRSSAHPYY